MANCFGVLASSRRYPLGRCQRVSETVIAAVLLLHERSVDDIAPQLNATELEQVITLVGRSPRLYAPGTLGALKQRRSLPAPTPSVGSAGTGPAARQSLAESAPPDPNAAPRPAAPTREPSKRLNALPKPGGFRRPQRRENSRKAGKSGTLTGTAAETARRRLIVRRPGESRPKHPHDRRRNRHFSFCGPPRQDGHRQSGSQEEACRNRDNLRASRPQTLPPAAKASMSDKTRATSPTCLNKPPGGGMRFAPETG